MVLLLMALRIASSPGSGEGDRWCLGSSHRVASCPPLGMSDVRPPMEPVSKREARGEGDGDGGILGAYVAPVKGGEGKRRLVWASGRKCWGRKPHLEGRRRREGGCPERPAVGRSPAGSTTPAHERGGKGKMSLERDWKGQWRKPVA